MSNSKAPHPKRPVSARQLAANRANAARSTGPRTLEGKARSAQNSRRHGFAAADFAVVSLEDLQAVANLKSDLVAVYQPVNSQELFALERMALAQQALLRSARPGRPLGRGLFTYCLDDAVDSRGDGFIPMKESLTEDLEVTDGQDHNFALAHGFSRMVQRGNTWTLFLRYQAQAERLYRRAVEEFERLKAQRHEIPNEAISEGQPDEYPTPSAPHETNPSAHGPGIEDVTPSDSSQAAKSNAPVGGGLNMAPIRAVTGCPGQGAVEAVGEAGNRENSNHNRAHEFQCRTRQRVKSR